MWRADIKKQPLTGAFAEVTFDQLTTKPSKVFKNLKDQPEVFGRLTQLRTMHGYNPHFYHHILKHEFDPNKSNCICRHFLPPNPLQRFQNHVLHSCEAYEDHRHILSNVSQQHHVTILLGSSKGLLAMARFLKETGAFSASGRPYYPPTTPKLPGLELHDPP